MNSLVLPLVLFVAACLIWGAFWSGYQIARRLTANPFAGVFLTLIFGSVFIGILVVGLAAGCGLISIPHS